MLTVMSNAEFKEGGGAGWSRIYKMQIFTEIDECNAQNEDTNMTQIS